MTLTSDAIAADPVRAMTGDEIRELIAENKRLREENERLLLENQHLRMDIEEMSDEQHQRGQESDEWRAIHKELRGCREENEQLVAGNERLAQLAPWGVLDGDEQGRNDLT